MVLLGSLPKSNFFTRVAIASFLLQSSFTRIFVRVSLLSLVLHLPCTRIVVIVSVVPLHVALVSQWYCSCRTRVAPVLLVPATHDVR